MAAPDAPAAALGRMLAPSSVAVVGASPREGALSRRFVTGLLRHGFPGRVVPVNPRYREVEGLSCAASLAEAGAVDLAIVALPRRLVLATLEQCAAVGVAGAVVFASGYSETGAEGRAAEHEIAELARRTGLRVLGPNSPGLLNVTHSVCAIASGVSFRDGFLPGGVAVLAQSGGVAGLLVERAQDRGVGLSCVVCTGNEADVTVGELLLYLSRDPATKAVALFLEGVRDGARFAKGLRAVHEAGKAAIVLKAGGTEAASRASEAHTGALATADDVLDAVLARHGAARVHSPDELIDAAAALSLHGRARSRAVCIVSTSGGAGVLAAEAAERAGLELPPPPEDAVADLAAVLPDFASLSNPADMSGMFVEEREIFLRSLAALLRPGAYGAVVLVLTVHPPALADDLAERTIEAAARAEAPLVVLWIAGAMSEHARARLRQAGLLVVEDADRCMRALAARASVGGELPELRPSPSPRLPAELERAAAAGAALEHEVLAALAAAGIPVVETRFCTSAEEAARAAAELGGRVAVKVAARGLAHKAAAGGVALGVEGAPAAAVAYERVISAAGAAEGAVVQRMAPPGTETIVGVRRDPTFGPVLVAGRGGADAELLADVERRLLPLARGEAQELAARLPAGDRVAFAQAVEQIADVALALGERLEALEINPLIVHEQGATAVDALLLFAKEVA